MDAIADDADSGSFTEGAIARSCICIITALIRGMFRLRAGGWPRGYPLNMTTIKASRVTADTNPLPS
jgi:hypothetical protein